MDEKYLIYHYVSSSYDINNFAQDIVEDYNLKIGLESNFSYDIIYKNMLICKEKKNYVSDFIFNIEKIKNIGYSYEIRIEKAYYSNSLDFYIYCDPDILYNKIFK